MRAKKYISVLGNDNFSQKTLIVVKQKNILIKAQFTKNNAIHIVKVEISLPPLKNGEIKALIKNKATEIIKPIRVVGHKVDTF